MEKKKLFKKLVYYFFIQLTINLFYYRNRYIKPSQQKRFNYLKSVENSNHSSQVPFIVQLPIGNILLDIEQMQQINKCNRQCMKLWLSSTDCIYHESTSILGGIYDGKIQTKLFSAIFLKNQSIKILNTQAKKPMVRFENSLFNLNFNSLELTIADKIT